MSDLTAWEGRTETAADVVAPTPARALAATLDVSAPESALSPLWHWLYFLPLAPASEIGPDGHPRRGGFLPPITLPRRMWAGGRLVFHDAPRIGEAITRTSTILKVVENSGASGSMAFVTVRHQITTPRGLAIDEEQDIVFLEIPKAFTPLAPTPLPDGLSFDHARKIDEVMLFRYSAITFNAHRIHYDRAHARDVEKYPGLVVHGPLQAMLLMEAARAFSPERGVARFAFRAVRPLFDFDTARVCGKAQENGLELFTANGDGHVSMQAQLTFSP